MTLPSQIINLTSSSELNVQGNLCSHDNFYLISQVAHHDYGVETAYLELVSLRCHFPRDYRPNLFGAGANYPSRLGPSTRFSSHPGHS